MQTGFGRTGDKFWAFEDHGIKPDIVTMAKGIGNGFPLAAVVTTPKIAAELRPNLYFNTYGGNPLACAAGIAVLDVRLISVKASFQSLFLGNKSGETSIKLSNCGHLLIKPIKKTE